MRFNAAPNGHNCNGPGCPICDPWRDTRALDEAREEIAALKKLLASILASSEDGSIEIPDVTHAMEASIKDALNGSLAPREKLHSREDDNG